jgi:hypothetical protein
LTSFFLSVPCAFQLLRLLHRNYTQLAILILRQSERSSHCQLTGTANYATTARCFGCNLLLPAATRKPTPKLQS